MMDPDGDGPSGIVPVSMPYTPGNDVDGPGTFAEPGDVIDPEIRTISNLVVDQTLGNPAAILTALQRAGVDPSQQLAITAAITAAYTPISAYFQDVAAAERVDAALHDWPQAPFQYKIETDSNYKRMLQYGMAHLGAVRLGVASHNIFDLAYGLVLASRTDAEERVQFEMLEGMANHQRRWSDLRRRAGETVASGRRARAPRRRPGSPPTFAATPAASGMAWRSTATSSCPAGSAGTAGASAPARSPMKRYPNACWVWM